MIRLICLIIAISVPITVLGSFKDKVILEVPVVKQGKQMCGPATLEMIFKYWGEKDYSQYDIARSLLDQFSSSKRYIKSGILESNPIDWSKYPGTGTINIREFLKRFGHVKNIMLENQPTSSIEPERLFHVIKESVSNGLPVIVHQYWGKFGSGGHYRIVTGYDESQKIVYLNDANGGKRLTQSYTEYMGKWNFNQRWMHYNAIIFEPNAAPLDAAL